jgi:phosphoenolpyruvate carboxylase
MDAVLRGLPREDTNMVVRAFSYFSHLANIAEDQHHIRRARAHARAGAAPREGSLALSLQRALAAGIDAGKLRDFFAGAQVRPVLTAHPTEVQRKSILDCQWKIARLLDERDRTELSPEEQAEHDEALRRAVLRLWQTRMLRRAKLSVMDEVNNALSFYDMTFLRELPRLYNAARTTWPPPYPAGMRRAWPNCRPSCAPVPGSAATATATPSSPPRCWKSAMRAQSRKAIGYLLEQLHQLGAELSTTTSLIEVPDVELMRLAEQSPDRSPHRLDEPYRRAIAGFYARLAATALRARPPRSAAPCRRRRRALCHGGRIRRRPRRAAPFADQPQLRPARARPPAPPAPCRRHLRLPPGAARPAPELRRACAHRRRTAGHRPPRQRLPGARRGRRIALLLDELATPRPLTAPGVDYSDETRGELAIFHTARASTSATARRRSRTSSSPRPTASPTSSKSPCCSRKSACCGRWNTRWT